MEKQFEPELSSEQESEFTIEVIEKENFIIELKISSEEEIIEAIDMDLIDYARRVKEIKIIFKETKKELIIDEDDLPPGWVFMRDSQDKFRYNYNLKAVLFGGLSKDGSFLSLFHEVGHSYDFFNCEEKQKKDGADEIKYGRSIETIARQERDAWAFSLKKIRKYKSEDIELEPEIENLKEYYKSRLKTYDLRYFKEIRGNPVFLTNDDEWSELVRNLYDKYGPIKGEAELRKLLEKE